MEGKGYLRGVICRPYQSLKGFGCLKVRAKAFNQCDSMKGFIVDATSRLLVYGMPLASGNSGRETMILVASE